MQGPLQPAYVLRGHAAAIHSVVFLRHNTRLLTGDADGWVVLWDLTTRRPAATWKAHIAVILGLGSWDDDKIITHGRDSSLKVWQLRVEQESGMSKYLPVDDNTSQDISEPWLLHSLKVNTLNFCSFTSLAQRSATAQSDLLVAVSGANEESILIYTLPSESIVGQIPLPPRDKAGMLMCMRMFTRQPSIHVLGGLETGAAMLWKQSEDKRAWATMYHIKIHSQPVLSLDITPDTACFFTSGADAIVARVDIDTGDVQPMSTKHAGQQGLCARSDGRIFATAGWDGRGRIYSCRTMQEVAVLKHHDDGAYATAFAQILPDTRDTTHSDTLSSDAVVLAGRGTTVAQRRAQKTQNTHWLALGAKDGKLSLWDVF